MPRYPGIYDSWVQCRPVEHPIAITIRIYSHRAIFSRTDIYDYCAAISGRKGEYFPIQPECENGRCFYR